MIKWCIYLRHLSQSAYETLRQSHCLQLPSQRTLRDYTHHIKPSSGYCWRWALSYTSCVISRCSINLLLPKYLLEIQMYLVELFPAASLLHSEWWSLNKRVLLHQLLCHAKLVLLPIETAGAIAASSGDVDQIISAWYNSRNGRYNWTLIDLHLNTMTP